jgi:hypothetical protein
LRLPYHLSNSSSGVKPPLQPKRERFYQHFAGRERLGYEITAAAED